MRWRALSVLAGVLAFVLLVASWRFLKGLEAAEEMHWAVQQGRTAPVSRLLTSHPRLARHCWEEDGRTFLHEAALHGHKDVAVMLLVKGADVKARDKLWCTPLHLAAQSGCVELAGLLLAEGADADAVTHRGKTPLHLAAACGHAEMAKLLLAGGADVNAQDADGDTPLRCAAKKGRPGIVRLLKMHGAGE